MIFLLLIIFQLKHFLADYPLQGSYMLGKFQNGWQWVLPLTAHAGVHLGFTFVICLAYSGNLNLASLLALLDFGLHFSMDRIKASPKLLGRYKALSSYEYKQLAIMLKGFDCIDFQGINIDHYYAEGLIKSNKKFWWALGLDQMVHHLTDILIIYLVMK